jgi:hypothetical protein
MVLKEFIITNISPDISIVVRTKGNVFGLKPKESRKVLAEKIFDIQCPRELVEITNGKRNFFKVNENIIEIDHSGKVLSGSEMKISDVISEINTIKETKQKVVNDVNEKIKGLAQEIKTDVEKSKQKTPTSKEVKTSAETKPKRGRPSTKAKEDGAKK